VRDGTPDIDLSHAARRKSKYSNNDGACVEVATNLPGLVAVRDSKDPSGPSLVFRADSWKAFLRTMQDGNSALARHLDWKAFRLSGQPSTRASSSARST
jgi:Domain of unknown function (DUF397)